MNLYLIGGVAFVVMGLTATVLFYRGEAIQAQANFELKQRELDKAVEVNKQNMEAINRLTVYNRAVDNTLVQLNASLDKIEDNSEQLRLSLEGLTDDESRNYLNGTVPANVRGLLNKP